MIQRRPPVIIVFLIAFVSLFSQEKYKAHTEIRWQADVFQRNAALKPSPVLIASNVVLNNDLMPEVVVTQAVAHEGRASIRLTNVSVIPVSETKLTPQVIASLTGSFEVRYAYHTQNKHPEISVYIKGLRKSVSGGIEALAAADCEIEILSALNKTIGSTAFVAKSVLAEGKIIRLAILNTGMYKLDYNFFKNHGYDMNGLDPRKIHIYGKGGGMLPRANTTFRYDDLPENPVYIKGESDGVFNSQDYVVFYGKGQTTWQPDGKGFYRHRSNYYSDTVYYFLKVDATDGKRVIQKTGPSASPTTTVNSGDEYFVHEVNKVNDYQSGAELLGESFSKNISQTFAFSIPNLITSEPVYFRSSEVAHSVTATTSFSISNNGNPIATHVCNVIEEAYDQPYYSAIAFTEKQINATSENFSINFTFNKNGNNDARGWLDFFEVIGRRSLELRGGQMFFRDQKSVGSGAIAQFELKTGQAVKVWDVTDAANATGMDAVFTSPNTTFKANADSLKEYACFIDDAVNFYAPVADAEVANQNLHASAFADLIIVTHPDFQAQANRLADYRRQHDGLRVLVVTPREIYNEFSSGAQDITAIREFIRMLYNKAATPADEPKYLLLFGDASYQYKDSKVFIEADNRWYDNTNYVPTFESDNYYDTDSYVSDDYYGLLDDNEGVWLEGTHENIDIGIGRLPVTNADQARMMVDKILRYESAASLGDWRNALTFIADDQDYNSHLNESAEVSNAIESVHKEYSIGKIYLDAYKQVSLGSGFSYPDATDAVNRSIQKGTLLFNYTGHGSSTQLAHESLITLPRDITSWKNKFVLPVFFTATCEFTMFDHISFVSAGENILLNPDGGGVGLLTTTRVAYGSLNKLLNLNFASANAFEKTAEGGKRIGDIMKLTKNRNTINSSPAIRHFIYLGDPSMRMGLPRYNVLTKKINGNAVNAGSSDTLRALQKITIEGIVADIDSNVVSSFNGEISVTVFDKPGTFTTLANDDDSYKQSFSMYKNFIFKGKSVVDKGVFKIEFVVPKDIAYNFGKAKISYYASDLKNNTDGNGGYAGIIVGGSAASAVTDNTGPLVNVFMNDTTFTSGGYTDQNPLLLVHLFDANGINTSGVSIGHEMTAVLDADAAEPIILNDYYEGTVNDFRRGTIEFPLYNLSPGNHTITVKAWDIYNNSGTGTVNFIVVSKDSFRIKNLLCYPNPLRTGSTTFSFEHNKAGEALSVDIDIYSMTGEWLRHLNVPSSNGSARFDELAWNGDTEGGAPLPNGTYLFRATVKDKTGARVQEASRIVIMR